MPKLNKTDELVIKTLKTEEKGLTLQEIAEKSGETQKKVFRSLRKLFEHEMITTKERKYKLLKQTPPTSTDEETTEDDPE
jgi:predicted transcriptional regulator